MKHFIPFCTILVLYLTSYTVSFAKDPERHPLLQRAIEEKNIKIYYLGRNYGMDGWALEGGKNVQYAYSTPEGGIVFGLQFGPDGQIETANQVKSIQGQIKENKKISNGNTPVTLQKEEEVKKTSLIHNNKSEQKKDTKTSKSKKFYEETEKASWVTIGDKKAPYIYIYINVNCDHCQEYWKDISNAVNTGSVQVRLIPFGRVDINRTAGAALLSVKSPEIAWKSFVNGNKESLATNLATKESYLKIDNNSKLWNKWQLKTSPFTVYQTSKNAKIKIIAGRPDNVLLLLSEIMK